MTDKEIAQPYQVGQSDRLDGSSPIDELIFCKSRTSRAARV
ncbi:hypothetical protein ABIF73_000837 [Bradyrhizobium japonicum]